ncbi:MAG: exodeoxyribonuclease VII small subunit [Clostridiales Family XIII bacterium]|jgi:exodeoxyribonuclease VII small subunit|nr:exodeoxyribonuclease VII small subunit [Clostridiales Family XIII bacterium]
MTEKTMPKDGGRRSGKAAKARALSFEEALAGLERSVEALKGEGTTLAEVVDGFEEGMAFYERCKAILDEAKQKIEVYGKDGF